MNKKNLLLLIAIFSILLVVAGCSKKEEPVTPTATVAEELDAVTTASIVDEGSAFLQSVGKDGTWIIAVLNDLTLTEEVVVDGQFTHNDDIYRKLAFYAQDESHAITARYTVTAPKMIVRSENTRIQGGTFKGDVYVEANGFHLVSGTVDGNVYFMNQEYLDSFTKDDDSSVTGVTELQ